MDNILNIDKPLGFTSHDVVEIIRRNLKIKKVGHAGTLDPYASGVLIILLEKATKMMPQFLNFEKEYVAEIKFGISTDTYDAEGIIEEINNSAFNLNDLESILPSFKGNIEQFPPKFSALHFQGKRFYELARENIDFEIKPRAITIYDLKILDFENVKFPALKLKITCSKGTYIRSLAHDLGQKLGCGAYLKSLVRTRIGNYTLEQAKNLGEIHGNYTQ
jgi:tRNA pseudouridine55 synthase